MLAQRHSPLTQITPDNVKNLELQWVFQARSLEKFEATPLVVDGVMYTVQPPNDVVALDAATGRVFWVYPYIPSPLARLCCGRVNRGLAHSREHALHGDDRRPPDCARREDRRAGVERGGRRRASRDRLLADRRAAGHQGQGDHRDRRRRVRRARISRRVRRQERQGSLAVPHHPRAWRAADARHGPAIRGRPAAARSGSPARTIPIST